MDVERLAAADRHCGPGLTLVLRRSYGPIPTVPALPESAVRVSSTARFAVDDPTRALVFDALRQAKTETDDQRLARLIPRVAVEALTGYTTVRQGVDVDLAASLAPAIAAGCTALTTPERAIFTAVCGYQGVTVETD